MGEEVESDHMPLMVQIYKEYRKELKEKQSGNKR